MYEKQIDKQSIAGVYYVPNLIITSSTVKYILSFFYRFNERVSTIKIWNNIFISYNTINFTLIYL